MFVNKWSGCARDTLQTVTSAFVAFGAMALALSACTSDNEVAGVSTVETENAYVIQVVDKDGAPVVGAVARLRPADYLPELSPALAMKTASENVDVVKFLEQDSLVKPQDLSRGVCHLDRQVCVYESDSLGFIFLDRAIADSMSLEILDGQRGSFTTLVANEIQEGDSAEITVNPYGMMDGKVELPEGEKFAWVQIYGTERKMKTDSLGNFGFGELAPGDYRIRIVVGETVTEESKNVVPYVRPAVSSSSSMPESSAAESSSSEEILNYLSVIDFENGLKSNIVFAGDSSELYLKPTDTTSVVMSPGEYEAELSIVEAGAGREGHAMHWTTSAKTGQWSFMGLWMCSSTNPCDFSVVDSIVYYVRGTGSYSFNLETIIDGATGKAVFLDTLQGADEWERVVVRPSDFMEGDSTYGNMGWDFVSKQVTNIAVPAYFDTEIWIDDIRFYGVTKEDLP